MAESSGAVASAFVDFTEPSQWTGTGPKQQQDNEVTMSNADDGSSDVQDEPLALKADTQHSSETRDHDDGPYSD
ncbi:hypothetical protein LTR95_009903 [Oleoguttula sp. CCFEE 5521]